MKKIQAILGIVAGAIMILSAFAHTFLGWQAMGGRLADTNAPADLITGFRVGWVWGGPPMVVFGILTIAAFVDRFRGRAISKLAPVLIATLYIGFALWAFAVTAGDPFFVIFLVPGLLLAVALIA